MIELTSHVWHVREVDKVEDYWEFVVNYHVKADDAAIRVLLQPEIQQPVRWVAGRLGTPDAGR